MSDQERRGQGADGGEEGNPSADRRSPGRRGLPSRRRWLALATVSLLCVGALGLLSGGRATVLLRALERFLESAGPWAPVAFVALYAGLMCVLVPSAPLTALGGVLFGPYRGFGIVWVSGVLGASGAFLVARTFGRGFAVRHGGERFHRLDALVARRGLLAVFLLRLANLPLTPVSFALGLTGVRFRDYCVGTALGILPGTLAVTYVAGVAGDQWSGRSSQPLALSVALAALAVAVFVVTLRIARSKLKRPGPVRGDEGGSCPAASVREVREAR